MRLFHFQHKKKEDLRFFSPMNGKVDHLVVTPDEAFAGGMMGEGVVIFPNEGIVYAPCDGEITFVFPTKHAIGIKTASEYEVLIHVGISTVKLDGRGFDVLVNEGNQVKKGDRLMTFDLDLVNEVAGSCATPVIITNLPMKQHIDTVVPGDIKVGEEIFILCKKER